MENKEIDIFNSDEPLHDLMAIKNDDEDDNDSNVCLSCEG